MSLVSEADTDTAWSAPTTKCGGAASPSAAGGTSSQCSQAPCGRGEYNVPSRQHPGRRREGEPLAHAWNNEPLTAPAAGCGLHAAEARKRPAVTTQEDRAAVPSRHWAAVGHERPGSSRAELRRVSPAPHHEPRARRAAARGHAWPTAVPHVTKTIGHLLTACCVQPPRTPESRHGPAGRHRPGEAATGRHRTATERSGVRDRGGD